MTSGEGEKGFPSSSISPATSEHPGSLPGVSTDSVTTCGDLSWLNGSRRHTHTKLHLFFFFLLRKIRQIFAAGPVGNKGGSFYSFFILAWSCYRRGLLSSPLRHILFSHYDKVKKKYFFFALCMFRSSEGEMTLTHRC